MQPYRVVVIEQERPKATTTVVVTLERSPDIGSTLELPYGDTVIVRDVVSGPVGEHFGVIVAGRT